MDKNYADAAVKMKELMDGGMTMEEALAELKLAPKAASSTGTRTVIPDRVAHMNGMNSISELRKAIKIAFAKKSKGKDKPESVEKYQKEINAGQKRLNELLAEVNQAADPIAKAIELGEEPSSVVQRILDQYEDAADTGLKAVQEAKKLTNKTVKDLVANFDTSTPVEIHARLSGLGEDYLKVYTDRAGRNDQRILTINKRLNFIAAQVPGSENAPAPIEDTTPAPVEEPTPAPIEDTTPAPIEEPNPQDQSVEKSDKKNKKNRK